MITKEEYQKTLIRMWDSVRSDDTYKGNQRCYGVKCEICPMDTICQGSRFASVYDAIELVEKWGKEHPIKTNREVFMETVQEKFGDKINLDVFDSILDEQGCNLIIGECYSNGVCSTCKQKNFWDKEYKGVSNEKTKLD